MTLFYFYLFIYFYDESKLYRKVIFKIRIYLGKFYICWLWFRTGRWSSWTTKIMFGDGSSRWDRDACLQLHPEQEPDLEIRELQSSVLRPNQGHRTTIRYRNSHWEYVCVTEKAIILIAPHTYIPFYFINHWQECSELLPGLHQINFETFSQ